MSKRSQNVTRLLQVQVQLRRDAEARLARASNELQRLEDREIELVDAMSRDDATGFTLARTGGSSLRTLLVEQQQAEREKTACEERFKSVAARTVCVERLHLAVMRAERRDAEKKSLEELIDQEWARTTSLK